VFEAVEPPAVDDGLAEDLPQPSASAAPAAPMAPIACRLVTWRFFKRTSPDGSIERASALVGRDTDRT
jgi:hypothetical protein